MLKAVLKKALPAGRKLRRIRGGIAQGLLMQIDLREQLQRYIGLDEREILSSARRFSNAARTLVDIGANDGYYTMAFLNCPRAKVVACEPGPVYQQLLMNAVANGHELSDRFHLERRLIGNGPGEATLAELLMNLPTPIFIKVDVDGGEVRVLQSAQSYPHLNKIWWVVETHSRELENACIDWFSGHRYRSRVVCPAWWRRWIPERRPLEHNRWLIAEPFS